MKKSVVVFDFDGVLTKGGEGLKQRAWVVLTRPWSFNHKTTLKQWREELSGGKGSRYDILEKTFSEFSGDDEFRALVHAYADCYNTIVQKLLEQSGMPEGTEDVLAKLVEHRMLFVNSATPEKAVRESVQNFCIAHNFRGIYGQPLTKEENLVKAQHIAHVDKTCMLFVGDGDSDWIASKEFGCAFIGVANDWNKWRKETVPFPLINSIAELLALLENTDIPPTPLERGRHFFLP